MRQALSPREADAQATILEVARLRGWRAAHFRPALTSRGWRTPVAADGAGFPDLVLVRDRVVFAELKQKGARPGAEQVAWLDALVGAGAEVYLWTLEDLGWIGETLTPGWAFVPFGRSVTVGGSDLPGPRLVRGTVCAAPPAAWIPGHGRRDGLEGSTVSRRVPRVR